MTINFFHSNRATDLKKLESLNKIKEQNFSQIVKRTRKKIQGNNFDISKNNIAWFYPWNDGNPTMPFNYYKDGNLILKNCNNFSEISNIDELLLNMTEIHAEAYQNNIPILPLESFGIELTDGNTSSQYNGNANLVFLNPKLSRAIKRQVKDASVECTNYFLDIFIGKNFGDIVRKTRDLEFKLLELNKQMIMNNERSEKNYFLVEIDNTGGHYDFPTT